MLQRLIIRPKHMKAMISPGYTEPVGIWKINA